MSSNLTASAGRSFQAVPGHLRPPSVVEIGVVQKAPPSRRPSRRDLEFGTAEVDGVAIRRSSASEVGPLGDQRRQLIVEHSDVCEQSQRLVAEDEPHLLGTDAFADQIARTHAALIEAEATRRGSVQRRVEITERERPVRLLLLG